MAADEGSPLSGGSFNAGRVVRIGDTVVAAEALRWKARWFAEHGDLVR